MVGKEKIMKKYLLLISLVLTLLIFSYQIVYANEDFEGVIDRWNFAESINQLLENGVIDSRSARFTIGQLNADTSIRMELMRIHDDILPILARRFDELRLFVIRGTFENFLALTRHIIFAPTFIEQVDNGAFDFILFDFGIECCEENGHEFMSERDFKMSVTGFVSGRMVEMAVNVTMQYFGCPNSGIIKTASLVGLEYGNFKWQAE